MSHDQSPLFTLCRLLGIDLSLIPEKYKDIFDTPINIFKKNQNDFVIDIVGSSRDNMEKMNEKLMNIKVSMSKPIVLVRLIKDEPKGKEEAFDLVLVVLNPNSDIPFYIFLDTKSRKEGLLYQNRETKKRDVKDILEKRDQFNQTLNMMKLNNREFMYIYFRTHNIETDKMEGDNYVVMEFGRDEAKQFFGPSFFHLYLTLRNAMDSVCENRK